MDALIMTHAWSTQVTFPLIAIVLSTPIQPGHSMEHDVQGGQTRLWREHVP